MKSFKFLLTLIAVLTAAVVLPTQADGGVLTIYLTSQTTAAGGSGSVDLLLRNDMGTDVDVSAFDAIIEVTAGSGLTFTAVDESVSAPYSYIFGTIQTAPLGDISSPPSAMLSDTHASYVTITSGQTVGLGRLSYTLIPSTPVGTLPIVFTPDTTGYLTHVYDSAFNALPLFLTGGVITVTASVVPEPAHLCMLATGCLLFGARILRRRRAAEPHNNTAATP